jgi:[ribosomal protein S18]-alanine N-acetyltransferase
MVARPPVRLTIEAMRLEDLDEVQRIEQASFSTPWPENAYRSELLANRLASYLVARIEDRIVGSWHMAGCG